jgi:hypothetical protein
MPYELSFSKPIAVSDESQYINECCYGGDVVADLLLPTVKGRFEDIQTHQEDWGWFIWFRRGSALLAIDIFCDDPETGSFRIHLTSRAKRWLLPDIVTDLPELGEVKDLVIPLLQEWTGSRCQVIRLDKNHMPIEDAV